MTTATLQPTMSAITHRRYDHDPAATIEPGTAPVPTPKRGEVLVRVAAAGVDRATWHMVTGLPLIARLAFGLGRMRISPGRVLVGTIVTLGAEVTGVAVGERVYGFGTGTWADIAIAKAAAIAPAPTGFGDAELAAVPMGTTTALQALRDQGRVAAGERVLVLGASGGVGTAAVQLAKMFGAQVTAVASGPKLERLRELGADAVVDYRAADPCSGEERYDLILDIAGRRPVRAMRRALTPTGRIVFVGGEGGDRLTGGLGRQLGGLLGMLGSKQRGAFFVAAERAEELAEIAGLLREGRIRPVLDRTFAMRDAATALRALEEGAAFGTMTLVPDAAGPAGGSTD